MPAALPPAVLFFDVGGTLLRFTVEPSELYSRVLGDHGLSVPPGDLYRTMRAVESRFPVELGPDADSEAAYWRAYDAKILAALGVDAPPSLVDEVSRRFKAEVRLESFPETVGVLEAIHRTGLPMGVISNASHGILGDLERNGIRRFFEHVVYSQAVGAAKPDPRIFREALGRFGVGAAGAWHVGDNPEADVAGALGVGIRPILVDRGRGGDPRGAAVIPDLRGVLPLLQQEVGARP